VDKGMGWLDGGHWVVVGGWGTGGRRVNSDRSIGPPLGGGVGSTEGFIQSATRGRRDRPL